MSPLWSHSLAFLIVKIILSDKYIMTVRIRQLFVSVFLMIVSSLTELFRVEKAVLRQARLAWASFPLLLILLRAWNTTAVTGRAFNEVCLNSGGYETGDGNTSSLPKPCQVRRANLFISSLTLAGDLHLTTIKFLKCISRKLHERFEGETCIHWWQFQINVKYSVLQRTLLNYWIPLSLKAWQ